MRKNLTVGKRNDKISEGLQRTTNKAQERKHLENLTAETAGISGKEQTDMSKRIKMRVDVGGTVRWATGETQQEVILAAAKILAESGAIKSEARAILSPMRQLCGYVIGQDKPLTETAYKRTWERIGKKIDLHGATAHVFRHTYITMAAAHVDIKTLQSIAGHADISTTMNRYAHGRQDKIIAAGQALQTMYQ